MLKYSWCSEFGITQFELFFTFELFQTYCVNSQTADSASTATALFSGIKTNINTLGFDSGIVYDDPASELTANKVETILTWAQNAGMDTGKDWSVFIEQNAFITM